MDDYKKYLEKIGEYAEVVEIKYPLVIVTGFPHARLHEIVISEGGQSGEIFSIDNEFIEILMYAKEPVKIGTRFVRTDNFLQVPVGPELLGWVIDPLANPLFGNGTFKRPQTTLDLLSKVKGINDRARIKRPFHTGVTIIDLMIPLGKGQKELILGDRKIGKTSFILSAIRRQIAEGSIVIYGVIGKQQSDIRKLYEFSVREKLGDKMIVVATNSSDSPSLIFLTPYVAMGIAEHFCEAGNDVLVILDDLSTHAKFYREISLVARRFPGRDSYPGDIFFTHAKLLERTGNFKHKEKGEVSITSLPVVETVESDFTGYIATNIMGMTDGHIFFDNNAYYDGRRPAVNISLSVTRVGKQTQSVLEREINHELSAFLNQYERMQTYSHFGAELSSKVKKILKTGQALYQLFQQHYSQIMPEVVQIMLFGYIWSWSLEELDVMNVEKVKTIILKAYGDPQKRKLMETIIQVNTIYDLLTALEKNKSQFPLS